MMGAPKDCACGAPAVHFAWSNGERISRCAPCRVKAEELVAAEARNALMAEYSAAFAALAAHNREAISRVLFGSSVDAEAWRKRAAEVAARLDRAKAALAQAGMLPQ